MLRLRLIVMLTLSVAGPIAIPAWAAAATATDGAVTLYREGHYPEAQAAFEAAVVADPDDAVAHRYLGKLAGMRQERALAVEHLARAVDLAPDDHAIQFDYGVACSRHAETLGKTFSTAALARRGRVAMERAVELAPTVAQYHEGLIEFYRTAPRFVGGGMAKARAQAAILQTLDPLAGGIVIANLHLQDNAADEALATLRELLADHPDHPMLLYLLGRAALLSESANPEGVAALTRCLELPATDHPVPATHLHTMLGQLHAQRGDLPEARRAYAAALLADDQNRAAAKALNELERN